MTAPDVRTPRDVPALRIWLRDEWKPGAAYDRVAAGTIVSRSPNPNANPGDVSRWERETLERATLWWVGEDMVDLLLASARAVPDDVRVADVPEPAPSGLVVFAKPWWGIDTDDPTRQVQVDAIVWGGALLPPTIRPDTPPEGQTSVSISSYRRLVFEDGLSPGELELGVATAAIASGIPHGKGPSFSLTGSAWAPLGRSDWPVADELGSAPWPMSDHVRLSYVEDRKVLVALWTLLHQEGIAEQTVEYAPRQERRRNERAGVNPDLAHVRVVTLRRMHRVESEPSEDSAEHVEWSHRWLVTGHWRWQRVGPGRSQRRLTFVRPYVKGPDDKPLVVPETVKAFVR